MNPSDHSFAALDIGSNSFHLLIARARGGALQPLLKIKQMVQLGAGLDAQDKLDKEAVARGLDCLQLCAQRLQGLPNDHVRIVATHTLRQAQNADKFIALARDVLPYSIEIISGNEEARLIYLGVAHTTPDEGKRLIIDIGGGSSELMVGQGLTPSFLTSRSMGSRSFTQRFFSHGKLTAKRLRKATVAAQQELEQVLPRLRKLHWDTVYGTSGSIRSLHALAQSLFPQEDTSADTFSHSQLELLKDWLLQHRHCDELQHESIAIERRPMLPASIAILDALFSRLNITHLRVHDAALREGVLYELATEYLGQQDIRSRTIESLAHRYQVDAEQAERVQASAMQLFDACAKTWDVDETYWCQLLNWAAQLHEVGLHIHSSSKHKHSAYILRHADLPGFHREQQQVLAAMVRLQRKKVRLDELPDITVYSRDAILKLIALLRLAVLVNQDRQSEQAIAKVKVRPQGLHLQLTPNMEQDAVLLADLAIEKPQAKRLGLLLTWS